MDTTHVYDRAADGTLLPAKEAELPVDVDFLGVPFSEAKLFAIASAYERATGHRTPPPDFGPLGSRRRVSPGKPRPLPRARKFRADELRATTQD